MARYRCSAVFLIALVIVEFNQGWISAIKSLGQRVHDIDSCEPVVQDGKEIQQKTTFRVDDKRSYGKPGNESIPVKRKNCEIDVKRSSSGFPGQPLDCADIRASGMNVSGVYSIYPGIPLNVYCDMETAGGGWTVFQRRMDGSVNFFRTWSDYKNGFGSISSEHWLGNEKIHRLSNRRNYELRVDLEDFDGNTRYANYVLFKMADETGRYNLTVRGFSGTAGDALNYHNGQIFSTPDRKDVRFEKNNCAAKYRAGWWFKQCFVSNLNGLYHNGTDTGYTKFMGVIWHHGGKNIGYTFKTSEMKIRPVVGSQDSQ